MSGRVRRVSGLLGVAAALAFGQAPAAPPAEEHDVTELAKKTQNPVGDVVSVPFQFNFNNGGGLKDQSYFNLNFQPVIPLHLTPSVNMIMRTIVPINSMPGPDATRYSGIGDIQQEFILTPTKPGKVIWGIGPAFSYPTATSAGLSSGTWAAGGTALVVKTTKHWVVGSVVAQFSPLTDSNGPPRTNFMTWQYFVNYNFGKGWAIASAPVITANWDAPSGQQWTVPFGIGINRTLVFNRQPMTLGMQYYYNSKRPDNAPSNQLRFVVSFIFPQRPAPPIQR